MTLKKVLTSVLFGIICIILLTLLIYIIFVSCDDDDSKLKNLLSEIEIDDELPTNRLRILSMTPYRYFPAYKTLNTKKLKNNDIIVVKPKLLKNFISEILPKIDVPVILIFSDSALNSSCRSVYNYMNFLSNPNVKHVFSENWWSKTVLSPDILTKLTLLPIGTESKISCSINKYAETVLMEESKNAVDVLNKPTKVLSNAHLNIHKTPKSGHYNQREEMYVELKNNKLIDFWDTHRPTKQTWKVHNNYAFELSPTGNGLDCHRFYEAILLNTIPIVKDGPLTPLYKQFSCVIVKDWNEITEDNLKRWQKEIKIDKVPIKFGYWKKKILEIQNQ
jgi:hypothetical protein